MSQGITVSGQMWQPPSAAWVYAWGSDIFSVQLPPTYCSLGHNQLLAGPFS